MRAYIVSLKQRLAPLASPYLAALREGSLIHADFLETQIQFLFAVVFFSRPMAALAGRMPRPELRLSLLNNVADEHGDGNLSLCHERTFLMLLSRLGVTTGMIEKRALWPEVRAFNTALVGLCTLDDLYTAVAALGMIEDLFSGISAELGRSIVARDFLPAEQLIHYRAHELLDVAHADGFYQLLDGPYAAAPRHAYQIQQGLELGAYLLLRLYQDLYAARGRRWNRTVGGPHSLAEGWYLEPSTEGNSAKP